MGRWASRTSPAVINGAGGSSWGLAMRPPRDADGWQVIPIDPPGQARIDGRSHGFCVMDDVGSEYTRTGNTIEVPAIPNRYWPAARARGTAPYFTLARRRRTHAAVSHPQILPVDRGDPAAAAGAGAPRRKAVRRMPDEFGEPLRTFEFFAARGETIGFAVAAETKIRRSRCRC